MTNEKLALLNTLKFSVWSSRGAGLVLAVDGFLIMLAVCRNLIRFLRPKIRFLPLDENLWFHRQTAYMLLLFAIIHTTAHYVNFFVVPQTMRIRLIVRLWKLFVRDLLRRYRFTMLRPVGLRDMSCFCACYSCTRLHMHQSGNNRSRHFGIHIIWRSSFCSLSTLTLRDVLYAIHTNRIVRLQGVCSGTIALDMKDGD